MTDDTTITRSSGNVFSDLGLPNSEDELIKAQLIAVLRNVLEERRINQSVAARIMGIAQPDVSRLLKGRLSGFSLERLLAILRALGSDVEIKVNTSGAERHGRTHLTVS